MRAPGRLEIEQLAVGACGCHLILTYRLEPIRTPREVHFRLRGTLGDQPLDEAFVLPADRAFDFLHEVDRRLRLKGLPLAESRVFTAHADYDPFFAELQCALGRHSGDPFDLSHLD